MPVRGLSSANWLALSVSSLALRYRAAAARSSSACSASLARIVFVAEILSLDRAHEKSKMSFLAAMSASLAGL